MYEGLTEKYPSAAKKMAEYTENPKMAEFIKPQVDWTEVENSCRDNEVLSELYEEMLNYFYRYTETVCQYDEILSQDLSDADVNARFQTLEEERTTIHNTTMDSVNILARNMGRLGQNNSWLQKVGESRADYGKLALTTIFSRLIEEQKTRLAKQEKQGE